VKATTHISGSRTVFMALVVAMWLSVPVIAFRYWQAWNQLPARMVTHFGANGEPNGWMTPQQSLTFSMTLLAFVLTLFTGIMLYALRGARHPHVTTWATLGLFYVIVPVVGLICDAVLEYNLSRSSIPLGVVGVALFISIFVFLAIFLSAQRGSELAASGTIYEETHASRSIAIALAVPMVPFIASAIIVPITGVKLALAVGALAMLGAAAMAWHGFHYSFSPAGVEVRTLGFRLRSIHADDIRSYVSDCWNALGGYGIRGIGNRRAYVWGNRGVRIRTSDGEVFLGHSEPEKIVRDLDEITNHKGHEGTRSV
jgi:Protein of unknown function (DUF1648)